MFLSSGFVLRVREKDRDTQTTATATVNEDNDNKNRTFSLHNCTTRILKRHRAAMEMLDSLTVKETLSNMGGVHHSAVQGYIDHHRSTCW